MTVNEAPEEQKELREYLRPLLKRWWLILAVVPLVTVGTYLYYEHKPKTYSSAAELYYEPSTLETLLFGRRPEATKLEDFALLIQAEPVHERAAELLTEEAETVQKSAEPTTAKSAATAPKNKKAAQKPDAKKPAAGKASKKKAQPPKKSAQAPKKSAQEPAAAEATPPKIPTGSVSAAAIEKTNFLTVSALASSPLAAAQVANAYSDAFIDLQREQIVREAHVGVEATRKKLKELGHEKEITGRREGLEKQLEELELVITQRRSGLKVIQEATPNPVPLNHDPTANAIFAFFIGLLLAIGAAYGLEYLNRKITRVEDVEGIYKLPVLTEVPQVSVPAPLEQQRVLMDKMMQGPFHRLQTNLDMLAKERPIRTIVVASAAPDEGKSIVARNLAIAYRETGHNVAVLDADLRKASMGGLLAAREGLGLTDILAGRATFGEAVQEISVHTEANGNGNGNGKVTEGQTAIALPTGELAMIPAGMHRGDRSLPLGSDQMRQTLLTAADTYGTAIIDSPPLLAVADAMPLLAEADAVILVMRMGVTTRDSARRILRELKRIPGVNVAGVVINGIPSRVYRARSYGYYYG